MKEDWKEKKESSAHRVWTCEKINEDREQYGLKKKKKRRMKE
jgi:hypothetical protein